MSLDSVTANFANFTIYVLNKSGILRDKIGINRVHKSFRREYIHNVHCTWGWGENMNWYVDKHILY